MRTLLKADSAHPIPVHLAPLGKVRMHRAPLGKVTGQRSPLAARAQQVQHSAKHLVQIHRPGLGLATGSFQQGQDVGKLGAADSHMNYTLHPRIIIKRNIKIASYSFSN